jgi:hypothetical protein
MKISSWPAWLPYPISCLKGFVLSYAFTSAVKSEFPLQPGESIVPILIAGWIWVTLLFTFFNWASTFVVNRLFAHLPQNPTLESLRQRLTTWSNTKQPPWKEGLNAFIISFIASILVTFVVFTIVPAPSRLNAYSYNSYKLRQTMIQVRFTLIPIGMTVISAYLYQYDLWTRQRRAAKQERRSQSSTPPTPSPVEPQVKPVNTQAAPEVADWYVFRSGKAEGPYSKLQLWEVQKITARTKVRRGEAEWQRAGEISELAKFLTDK